MGTAWQDFVDTDAGRFPTVKAALCAVLWVIAAYSWLTL